MHWVWCVYKAKNDMYVAYHAYSSYRYSISMQVYFRYLNHLLRVVMVAIVHSKLSLFLCGSYNILSFPLN